jgi:hypothetical protein
MGNIPRRKGVRALPAGCDAAAVPPDDDDDDELPPFPPGIHSFLSSHISAQSSPQTLRMTSLLSERQKDEL